MYCTNCGSKLEEDALFCTKCGTHKDSTDKYLYCENCGSKITEDSAFCTGCGTPIPEEILETRKKLLKKQEEQKKIKKEDGKKRAIVYCIILIVIEILNFPLLGGMVCLISAIISIFIVVVGIKQLPKIKSYKEGKLTIFWVIMIVIGFIPIIIMLLHIIASLIAYYW